MAVRTKMSREDRAKQFMPFAALKGFEEALRKVEEQCTKTNAGLMYDPDKINRDEDGYDE